MDLRSVGRKLSSKNLHSAQSRDEGDDEELQVHGSLFCQSNSDPLAAHESQSPSMKRKHKRKNKENKKEEGACTIIQENADSDHWKLTVIDNGNGQVLNGVKFDCRSHSTT